MPKIKRKLTEKEIISAKPKDKPYRLHDDRALSVLVRETGTKVWQYRYHILGKANVYTIGKVGEITTAVPVSDDTRRMLLHGNGELILPGPMPFCFLFRPGITLPIPLVSPVVGS